MNRIFKLLLVSLVFGFSPRIYGQVIFVQSEGIGDGSSWTNALNDIHSALAIAESGDQIWIATGEYYPTNCTPCGDSEREIGFTIPQGVSVYGGFEGNESSISERTIHSNPTVLNGNIGDPTIREDNSWSILKLEYPNQNNIIDGLIFKNGNADGEGDSLGPKLSGGAIHIKSNGSSSATSLSIKNCSFINNRAKAYGGAIQVYAGFGGNSQISVQNCHFEGNSSDSKGGAIYCYAAFDGTITGEFVNSSFEQNRSIEGGAFNVVGAKDGLTNIEFTDCNFNFNEAESKGGALATYTSTGEGINNFERCYFSNNKANRGGAIFLDGSEGGKSNGDYDYCTFEANVGKAGGGAIYNDGANGESNTNYFQCVFKSNYCIQSGAAFFNSGASGGECLTVYDKCRFIDNETTMYGAGMYNFGKTGNSSPTITNCLFVGNESDSGTSIYSYGGQGGLSEPEVINTTFTKNIARVGPCIYNQASDTTGTVRPFVSNCIFWDNIATSGFGLVFQNGHAEPTIQYSIIPFDDCTLLNTQPNSTLTCGPGILFNTNPNFINPNNHDFRLGALSPAIDMGIAYNDFADSFDLDGSNRVLNSIDLGPFELDPNSPMLITTQPASGTFCEGTEVAISVETTGGSPLSYEWYHNGIAISTSNSAIINFSSITTSNAGNYYCKIETIAGDLISSEARLDIKETNNPQIELLTESLEFCDTDTVKVVQAMIQDAGYFDKLTWSLNGSELNEQSNLLTIAVQDEDVLSAHLESSAICVGTSIEVSDSIEFEELSVLTASVTIESDQASYCANQEIQVEAITTNGGDQPIFSWVLNGQPLSNSTSSLVLQNIEDGDILFVEMTSSLDCILTAEVQSQELTFEILPMVEPTVNLMGNLLDSFCIDSTEIFSLNTTFPGLVPVFNWYLDGELQMNHEETWPLMFEDLGAYTIVGELISSENCADPINIMSDPFSFEVYSCLKSNVEQLKFPDLKIFPNPTTGLLNIKAENLDFNSAVTIRIFNNIGQLVFDFKSENSGEIIEELDLNYLSKGTYIIQISSKEFINTERFILIK